MAFFWYNPFSGEKLPSQFIGYLQARSFVNDIRGTIAASTALTVIQHHRDIEDATKIVVGSIDDGFKRLQDQNAELKSTFDWRLSLVVDQQRIANVLSKNIALLLRIPDAEKQRVHFIEEGGRFYQNASVDAEFYADALDYFLRAEALKKQDLLRTSPNRPYLPSGS